MRKIKLMAGHHVYMQYLFATLFQLLGLNVNMTSIAINTTYFKLSWTFHMPKLLKPNISSIVYIRSDNGYVYNITVQEPEVIVAIPNLCIAYTVTIVPLCSSTVDLNFIMQTLQGGY